MTRKLSQTELYGELLDSEVQYRHDVGEHIPLTQEEEETLLQQARSGDTAAYQAIIESCLTYVMHVARKYAEISRACGRHVIEYLDLVQVGNLTLVEVFHKAIEHPSPFGYLKRAAAGEIIKYCAKHGTSITSPQERGGTFLAPKDVKSYDAPINNANGETYTLADTLIVTSEQKTQEKDYSPLYAALGHLTPRQQSVVTRHYGLEGASEDLYTISCSILVEQGKPLKENANAAYSAHKCAIARLRNTLETACA